MPFALSLNTSFVPAPQLSGAPLIASTAHQSQPSGKQDPNDDQSLAINGYRNGHRHKAKGTDQAPAMTFRPRIHSDATHTSALAPGHRPIRSFSMVYPGIQLRRRSRTGSGRLSEKVPALLPQQPSPPIFPADMAYQEYPAMHRPRVNPRAMSKVDRQLAALTDFLDARGVVGARTVHGPGFFLEALYRITEPHAANATAYRIANLPQSTGMASLVLKLANIQGLSLEFDKHAVQNDESGRYRLVAEMLMALLTRTTPSKETNVGGFDFLDAIRNKKTIAETAKNFTEHLFSGNTYVSSPAAGWTANMILQRLHPELARSDTPTQLIYGSLEWANLRIAIDLLNACGINHADFPHEMLMALAAHVTAGAKLNPGFGSFIRLVQIRTALWFAHGSSRIDLKNFNIDRDGSTEQVLKILDQENVRALNKKLMDMHAAIKTFIDHPAQKNYAPLLAAFHSKEVLLRFVSCIRPDNALTRERLMAKCGFKLSAADKAGFPAGSADARERHLSAILLRDIDMATVKDATDFFRIERGVSLTDNGAAWRPTSAQSDIRQAGLGGTPDDHNALMPDLSVARDFLQNLSKIVAVDSSLSALNRRLQPLTTAPLPPYVSSTAFLDQDGLTGRRFSLDGHPRVTHIENPLGEAKGIITIDLNGVLYRIDMLAPDPVLTRLNQAVDSAHAFPLCREERALGARGCYPSTQVTDVNGEIGRRIVHTEEFIQLESVWRDPERPRNEFVDFFHRNSGDLQNDTIAIIDQIPMRPMGRNGESAQTYRPISAKNPQYPAVQPLPDEFTAELIDDYQSERPMLEYELSSQLRTGGATGGLASTTQVRTGNRRDFRSRRRTNRENMSIGVIEIARGQFYAFSVPVMRGTQKVTLRRTRNPGDLAIFTSVETVKALIRSAKFLVQVKSIPGATIIKVLYRCGASSRIIEAIRTAIVRSRGSHRSHSDSMLETYLNSYDGNTAMSPGLTEDDPVLQDLNTALTEIMRSVTDTHALRNMLRENYEQTRGGQVTFGPLYNPRTLPGTMPEATAARAELANDLSLLSNIFTSLDFSAALRLPGADVRAAVNAVVASVFDIKKTRNFAIAEVKLASGEVTYYFSVSGTDDVPNYNHEAGYTLVRVSSVEPAMQTMPHFPNLTPLFTEQAREFDTERLIFLKLSQDFPVADDITEMTLYSRLDFCHSCTVCCIVYAEQHPKAKMRFVYLPPNPKPAGPSSLAK